MNSKELQIPYKNGFIAALEWGLPDGKPLLALHGWQDNALSFQPMVAYFPSHIHVIAIDFCGHGFSSHLDQGFTYDVFQYMMCVLAAANYLNWNKFSLMGHSMGGIVAVKFTAAFPDKIENLITLDILYPKVDIPFTDNMPLKDGVHLYLRQEAKEFSKNPVKPITWEEAVDTFSKVRDNICRKNVELLLQRGLKCSNTKEGSYEFTRDFRTSLGTFFEVTNLSASKTMEIFHEYRGTWLAILNDGSELPVNSKKSSGAVKDENTKNCKRFEVIKLDARSHYLHMEHPELVASHIKKLFLDQVISSHL